MAGPLPVVGLAAVVADSLRGRVDEADVVDLELGDLEVAEPLEERGDAAAEAVLLAGRRPLLDPALDHVEALPVGQLRVDLPGDLVGDLLHGDRHPDAGAGAVRELLVAGPREVAVDDEVLLGRRVVLERALDAVVVRRDEAVGRDERRAAAAERDDGVHREAGQVGPDLRVAREAELLQAGREVGNLLRHPHPLVGGEGKRGEKGRREDDGDTERFLQVESSLRNGRTLDYRAGTRGGHSSGTCDRAPQSPHRLRRVVRQDGVAPEEAVEPQPAVGSGVERRHGLSAPVGEGDVEGIDEEERPVRAEKLDAPRRPGLLQGDPAGREPRRPEPRRVEAGAGKGKDEAPAEDAERGELLSQAASHFRVEEAVALQLEGQPAVGRQERGDLGERRDPLGGELRPTAGGRQRLQLGERPRFDAAPPVRRPLERARRGCRRRRRRPRGGGRSRGCRRRPRAPAGTRRGCSPGRRPGSRGAP